MNYQKIYQSLVDCAKDRCLVVDTYLEIHHIVPLCLGGDNRKDNLVSLTPEEHYVAHQLLIKIYPNNHKLIYAANRMSSWSHKNPRNNNKKYGWIRRRLQQAFREREVSEETRTRMAIARTGKKHTDECKERMSLAKKGQDGHLHTEESKRKISEARLKSNKVYRIKVETPDNVFSTIEEAARFYKVDPAAISYRCNSSSEKWKNWKRILPQ
jgi:hypothetical protein